MNVAKHLVDGNVVRSDPADPREVGEGLKKVSWEEIPDCGGGKTVEKKSFTAHTATISNTSVSLCMKRVEKRANDKVCWPDHRGRLYQEATSDTPNRKTDELGGHDNHPLV